MGFLKLTAEGRCESLRPAEIWKMQRGRKWIPEKTLCDGGCVWLCLRPAIHMVTGLQWLKSLSFFLNFGFRYDVGVWLCLFHSSIRLCLYIFLCLCSPSFTSSPLPPFLFHTQSILLSDRQRLLLILILLSVYTVSSTWRLMRFQCITVTQSLTARSLYVRLCVCFPLRVWKRVWC